MKPIAGLNRDSSPFTQPENTYRYMNNGTISENLGDAENLPADLDLGAVPNDTAYLGWVTGANATYYICYNTVLDQGQIYRVDPDGTLFTLIIRDPTNVLELDQEVGNILQFVTGQDAQGDDVIGWAGLAKPKLIDIGEEIAGGIPADLTGRTTNDFLLFPEASLSAPVLTEQPAGGNVLSGVYFFAYRYVYGDQATTDFSHVSNAAYIYEADPETPAALKGDAGNLVTDKSIMINVDLDPNQPDDAFIQFAFISIRGGVTFSAILPKVSVDSIDQSGTGFYTYTGETPETDLGDNALEILTNRAHYERLGTITLLTNRIYAGNLTLKEEVNLQEVANNITVEWTRPAFGESFGAKGSRSVQGHFGAGEVYALYIQAKYPDGTRSAAFHIPGRPYNAATDSGSDSTGDFDLWEVEDTIPAGAVATQGGMGYWANKSEVYPSAAEFDGARDTTGPNQNSVRHHKLPSHGYLMREGFVASPTNQPNFSLLLSNINIPAPIQDQISGFVILYARRTIGDQIQLSTEWPTFGGQTVQVAPRPVDPTKQHAIAGNWAFSDEDSAVPAPAPTTDVIPVTTLWRWHGLHLLANNPSISPRVLSIEAEWTPFPGGAILGRYLANSEEFTPIGGGGPTNAAYAYKYAAVSGLAMGNPTALPVGADRYKRIDASAYVRNGVKFALDTVDFDNTVGEDSFVTKISSGDSPAYGFSRFPDSFPMVYATMLSVPGAISSPFTNQSLVYAGDFDAAATTAAVTEGDSFEGAYQWNVTGVAGAYDDAFGAGPPAAPKFVLNTTTDQAGQLFGEGSKVVFYNFPVLSPVNHLLPIVDAGDPQSWVHPVLGNLGQNSAGTASVAMNETVRTELKNWYFYDMNIYASMTQSYNNDFNQLPAFFTNDINDGNLLFDSRLPTSIAFTPQQGAESPVREWRVWPINNRFVQPPERGEIINLRAAGNQRLYIHHRYSLYITKDRTTLQGTQDVTLGSSDIFDVVPYELISVDEGHTGLKNRNWQSLTPAGYVWINTDHGKIYLHTGQNKPPDEISSIGMRTFFRDHIEDSNFNTAYQVAYDEDQKRLFFSANGTSNDWNLSFSTIGNFWTSFHDSSFRTPIVLRDKRVLFSDNSNIFILAGGAFNNDAAHPFIVEVVMNEEDVDPKYLQAVKWSSNHFDPATGLDQEVETFNEFSIWNDTKFTGVIPLVPYTGFPKGAQNCRRVEKNWKMNQFRDLWDGATRIDRGLAQRFSPDPAAIDNGKEWYERSRMRDRVFFVRLEDNTSGNRQIRLSSVDFISKPSRR